MLEQIQQRLTPVRRRQRLFRTLDWATGGAFLGGLAGIVLALLGRADLGVSWWWPIAIVAGSVGCGALAGFWAPISWRSTASIVDQRCNLKDRSLTALDFASDDRADPLRRLQLADADAYLAKVDATNVLPQRRPFWIGQAIMANGLMLAVMLVPIPQEQVAGVPVETRQMVLEQADYLDETMLEELRELAGEDNEDVKELVEELEELVEELRDPEVDTREALAKLSMMQQTVAQSLAAFNLEQVDTAMQSIASSIDAAASLQKAAQDLKDQKYEEAAEELEQFDPNSLSNKERRAISGNLKQLSGELSKAKLSELSKATVQLVEGLEKKSDSQCKGGMCKLARLCKNQSLRKSICQCLGNQMNRLSQCKSQCNKNGCKGTSKSDSPSNNWGTGATNKPLGEEATALDSTRSREDLSGQQGEGPSEREVMTTAEARQVASRSYQQRYTEFRKQAEAVLESEPLPLGHRETVRTYFETIRPRDVSDAEN